ncbi:HAD family hydrolase [Sessilibacter sp. MAH4]
MTDSNRISCVLFDLDGTLLDTAPDFIRVLHTMRAVKQLPPLNEQDIRNTVSGGARQMVKLAFGGQPGETEFDRNLVDFLANYNDLLESNKSQSCLFEGIQTVIEQLESNQRKWGIVTNKPEKYSLPLMEQLSLNPPVLVCPEHVKEAKPSPEALFLACSKLNANPENSIYIGDHERDIIAGRAASMKTVVAGWGYFSETNPTQAWQADFYAENPLDLLEYC